MNASTASPSYPEYLSLEHLEWIAARSQRGLRFRQLCDDWNAQPDEAKRERAREILAGLR